MGKNKINSLELMAKNEELVSDLYKIYSEKFPDYSDLWIALSAEEIEHATWIHDLGSKIYDRSISFDENRFNLRAIKNFRDYMNGLLDDSQEQELTMESAVSNSLNIETALIERKFSRSLIRMQKN